MTDPNSPTLEALDAVTDYLDHVQRLRGGKKFAFLMLCSDGTGTVTIDGRKFGTIFRPIAEAYDEAQAWLAGTDEATKALDSEIGQPVDHLFVDAAP
jgi:hypothetical protein